MQARIFNNNSDSRIKGIRREERAPPGNFGINFEIEPNLENCPVTGIVSGLCKNLRNIHCYRMLMYEDIKTILKKR